MFDRCVVINLDRRTDRWGEFRERLPADWPFARPERWSAYDESPPDRLPPPHWHQSPGSWGCLQSHVAVLRTLVESDAETYLILEDDAVFAPNFSRKAVRFLEQVPETWAQLYLGGQHWRQADGLPMAVNGLVLQCFNVNRTHAYAIRRGFARIAVDYFAQQHDRHVDYLYGDLCERRCGEVYAPQGWLVGQAEGKSDIARQSKGRTELIRAETWWNVFQYLDEFGRKQTQR